MVRTLVLISIASLVLCIAAFTAAFAIAGGPFAIHDWRIDRDWSFSDGMEHHHGRHHRFHDSFALDTDEAGAHATRDFTWSGGDRLRVEVPADIVYTQGPEAKVTIAGPAEAVNRVHVASGRIDYGEDGPVGYDGARLKIVMTAPDVRRFDLSGSQNLVIEGFKQDRLELDISGAAHVSAKGQAREAALDIAGSGDADLHELAVQDARIDISGSGHTRIGPKGTARVDVSGDGEVELTAKPQKLITDISGSGKVSQPGAPD